MALAECSFGNVPLGARISNLELLGGGLRRDALLFGETQSRVLVSLPPSQKEAVIRLAHQHQVPIYQVGKVGRDKIVVEGLIEMTVTEAELIWRNAIERRIK